MSLEVYNLKIVLILTFGFTFASILGYLTLRLKLSPILGYLLAGYLIGPFSPGFVADLEISEQLAEIGVILMMFGVGLHFKWQDLVKVKNIAIPGAIGQTLIATIVGTLLIRSLGWTWESGIIIGLSIGVASTVVLVRVLSDNHLLETPEGHIAIGWLIVEDILTVAVLLLLPTLAVSQSGEELSVMQIFYSLGIVLIKFIFLLAFMFTLGSKLVTTVLISIARTHSQELFTLTVLALTFFIATGSAIVFGTSIALGAFIAGMVIGQTVVRHQASAYSLPMKDAFLVIFFLSVGMLFNPYAIIHHFGLFSCVLGIILLVKPITSFFIATALKYPAKIALTVSFALAQIGEFSFILSEEAMKYKILPDDGYDIIVASALISIALNPLIFKSLEYFQDKLGIERNETTSYLKEQSPKKPHAVVIGYGYIGRHVSHTLELMGFTTVIVDKNIDTISGLIEDKQQAIFGDSISPDIMNTAQLPKAKLLVVTIPKLNTILQTIHTARQLNPGVQIVVALKKVSEKEALGKLGVEIVCSQEETLEAFNHILIRIGKMYL